MRHHVSHPSGVEGLGCARCSLEVLVPSGLRCGEDHRTHRNPEQLSAPLLRVQGSMGGSRAHLLPLQLPHSAPGRDSCGLATHSTHLLNDSDDEPPDDPTHAVRSPRLATARTCLGLGTLAIRLPRGAREKRSSVRLLSSTSGSSRPSMTVTLSRRHVMARHVLVFVCL
jgi:hypothetical protein